MMNPLVRRSWSPVGQTPVIASDGGTRRKVSVIGAITVSPVIQKLGFSFATSVDGYFDTAAVVRFLRTLLKQLRGRVVVMWDGGSNHKGPLMREFLSRNRRVRLERFPAYAPEWNPVEAVWSWLKWGRLANGVPETLEELDEWIVKCLMDLDADPELLRRLWERSDLPFPQRRTYPKRH
jgi:putative transposase